MNVYVLREVGGELCLVAIHGHETKHMVILDEVVPELAYIKRVPKDNPRLATSPEEALHNFIIQAERSIQYQTQRKLSAEKALLKLNRQHAAAHKLLQQVSLADSETGKEDLP